MTRQTEIDAERLSLAKSISGYINEAELDMPNELIAESAALVTLSVVDFTESLPKDYHEHALRLSLALCPSKAIDKILEKIVKDISNQSKSND